MEIVFPNCAGIDVHKKFVTVCRCSVDQSGQTQRQTRTFGTMTGDIQALVVWLRETGCTHVAMESTGVYWLPLYNLLEPHFEVWLVNARHVKHVPGRKTDVHDARWLAQLLQHGLLRPSFIPPREQRELRDLVWHRQSLVEERTRVVNRIQKVLEDANLKLAAVVTDMQGVSARAILEALLSGTTDPVALAQLARGRLRTKQAELISALTGDLRPHHRFVLGRLLGQLDFVDAELQAWNEHIATILAEMPGYQAVIELLDSIPGVNIQTAILIVAEIGIDMSRFPSAKHLAAWAGLAPGNNETGGKARPTSSRKGNRYLRQGMVQAARAAARSKDSYLRALYHRLAGRRGKHKAAIAVARTLLEIVYHLIVRGETYRDLGADYFDRLDRERTAKRLLKRLEGLGYDTNGIALKSTDASVPG